MNKSTHLLANVGLSFLWLFTGITSVFFAKDVGYEVLANGGIDGWLATVAIYSGSLVDVTIGIWVLIGVQRRWCYQVQIWVVLIYSLLLTLIDPSFWLHPFGPLTKNMPILVLLFHLYQLEQDAER